MVGQPPPDAGEGEDAHRQAMTIYNQGQVWLLLAKQ